MGDQAGVVSFTTDDRFLRRVSKAGSIKRGAVGAGAFQDKHPTLSFTLQDAVLKDPAGLDRYQRDKALPSGDLPGICALTFHDLTESVKPPLPPRHEPDRADTKYGHLHCCTDRPIDDDHRDNLAKLATRNGVLCQFIPNRKVGVEPRT